MGIQDTKYAPEEESHDFDDGRNMKSDFYVAALGLVDDDAPSADWTYISGMTFSACTLKDANDAAYAESYDSSDLSVAATATDAADNHNSAPASATFAAHVQAVVATVIHPLDLASSAGDRCQIHQCGDATFHPNQMQHQLSGSVVPWPNYDFFALNGIRPFPAVYDPQMMAYYNYSIQASFYHQTIVSSTLGAATYADPGLAVTAAAAANYGL